MADSPTDEIKKTYATIAEGELSDSIKAYLRDWIIREKRDLWRKLCNCKPKLEDFLKIQARGLDIDKLQQDLLISKLKGERARETLEQVDSEVNIYDK